MTDRRLDQLVITGSSTSHLARPFRHVPPLAGWEICPAIGSASRTTWCLWDVYDRYLSWCTVSDAIVSFLSTIINGFSRLFGHSTHQAYRYIRSFPTDAPYIRLLVSMLNGLILRCHTCLTVSVLLGHYCDVLLSDPARISFGADFSAGY